MEPENHPPQKTPLDGASLGHELSLWVVLYHEALAARLGVNATEHKVLAVISRDPGISPTRLVAETGLSNAAITKILNHLATLGYVERRRDPSDGRRYAVLPTPAYRRAVDGLMTPMTEGMARVTGGLTETELRVVGRWLTGTVAVLREATASLADRPVGESGV